MKLMMSLGLGYPLGRQATTALSPRNQDLRAERSRSPVLSLITPTYLVDRDFILGITLELVLEILGALVARIARQIF
jgi:hypothetical protein